MCVCVYVCVCVRDKGNCLDKKQCFYNYPGTYT